MDKKQKNILFVSGGLLTTGAIVGTILFIRRRNKRKRAALPSGSATLLPNKTVPAGFRNWNGGTGYLSAAPRGIRNNNPGNLIYTPINWKGKIPKEQSVDDKFEMFMSPEYGLRAMIMDLQNDIQKGKNTIAAIMSEYAPRFENDTDAYIDIVSKDLKVSKKTHLLPSKNTLHLLVRSIARVENGGDYISKNLFDKAYAMI